MSRKVNVTKIESLGGDRMNENYSRETALIGVAAFEKLRSARVAVFGIGGVGSYTAEALVRAGVGAIDFIDGDTVAKSNLNRQIVALHSTLGKPKAEVMKARALDIDPDCRVNAFNFFFDERTADFFDMTAYDYVADCIDSVQSKVLLIKTVREAGVPVISCMGAGNKMNGSEFRVVPIEKTRECPLAKIMRRELKKVGIEGVKAVYSEEAPLQISKEGADGKKFIGSISFVPSAAGLLIAETIVKDLIAKS